MHLRDLGKRRRRGRGDRGSLRSLLDCWAMHSNSSDFAVRVEILSPPDGIQFQSSPVELAAVVMNQKGPLSNVSARITILTSGEAEELTGATNKDGISEGSLPSTVRKVHLVRRGKHGRVPNYCVTSQKLLSQSGVECSLSQPLQFQVSTSPP